MAAKLYLLHSCMLCMYQYIAHTSYCTQYMGEAIMQVRIGEVTSACVSNLPQEFLEFRCSDIISETIFGPKQWPLYIRINICFSTHCILQ